MSDSAFSSHMLSDYSTRGFSKTGLLMVIGAEIDEILHRLDQRGLDPTSDPASPTDSDYRRALLWFRSRLRRGLP